MASDVVTLNSATTLSGNDVIITDIEASYGVIHVVDTVILPPM